MKVHIISNLSLSILINNNMTENNRGSVQMNEDKQREQTSKNGHSAVKENNPGNMSNDPKRTSEASKEVA